MKSSPPTTEELRETFRRIDDSGKPGHGRAIAIIDAITEMAMENAGLIIEDQVTADIVLRTLTVVLDGAAMFHHATEIDPELAVVPVVIGIAKRA